ncbi:uncharacterized protein BJ212DRAFT_1489694 [Suillus subaureus]|uniref:Uncharacterized protein n=1 Tax=Suillus subaureus TaxID=48587 RepID=A0A9P7AU79_9AGAM|nr:uncharacterized protein BJ212DRAFT_1489694 [Suillus subaureus]KAG1795564.1 hypothetical protein BJ212DRAFT_1489694 [Suillus subaureus]
MTILKPARGSSLNPSHVSADMQINLPDEQPQPPMTSFNPHQQQPTFDAHNQPSTGHSNYGYSGPSSASFNSYIGYSNSLSGAGYGNSLPSTGYSNSLSGAGYGPAGAPSSINYNAPLFISSPDPSDVAPTPVPDPVPIVPTQLTRPIPYWLGGDADAKHALIYGPTADEIPASNVIHVPQDLLKDADTPNACPQRHHWHLSYAIPDSQL